MNIHKIDILTLNEAKLVSSISSNDIHLSGYDVVRRDRYHNGRHGGGVCIFVKNNLNFRIREDLMIMITLNFFRLKFMDIGSRQCFATFDNHMLRVPVDNEPLVRKVNSTKTLELTLDENLTWKNHIEAISKKVSSRIEALKYAD